MAWFIVDGSFFSESGGWLRKGGEKILLITQNWSEGINELLLETLI
jgi:hypothetical protein